MGVFVELGMESYAMVSLNRKVLFWKLAISCTKRFDRNSHSPQSIKHLVFFCFVFQPKRIYYLEDHTGYAMEWVKKIEEVHRAYFGDTTQL